MKLRLSILALASAFFLASCGLFSDRGIDLPSTPILTGGSGWVIVKSSYVRLKEKPDTAAADLAAVRDGTVAQVTGRERNAADSSLWFRIKATDDSPGAKPEAFIEGWVPEGELDLYATKAQADRALKAKSGKN